MGGNTQLIHRRLYGARSRLIERLEPRRLLAVSPGNSAIAIPFQHIVIDANPGAAPLEKLLMDVDGDGKLDVVVGFSSINTGSEGGVFWYQFPHSGNPADHWNRYTIAPKGGNAYEDVIAYDFNGDGAMDFVAGYNSSTIWFENPAGHGGDPAAGPWVQHLIGPDSSHDMTMADFDGDGKIDIASNLHIYFQDSPTSWQRISIPQYNRAQRGVNVFDSGSGLGAVDLLGAGPSPYPIAWLENPRDHGGNARTDVWQFHKIGDNYTQGNPNDAAAYAGIDVNGDGRMDVITTMSERTGTANPGALWWWEAPADRGGDGWIKHVIDGTLQDVHRIELADMNQDGLTDIIFAEQEQSTQDRVGIYYKLDDTGDNWQLQVLSNTSGQNVDIGDINGDGSLDILNGPHGVYTHVNPIEMYLNELVGSGTTAISGTIWNDADANGVPTSEERGLGNWRVFIDDNRDGVWQLNERSVLTDSKGNYSFSSLNPGSYRVCEVLPDGWRRTSRSAFYSVAVGSASIATKRHFGNTQKVLVAGTIWNDGNADGLVSTGETALSGQQVFLDINKDGRWQASEPITLTDSSGNYVFNNLVAGTYRIVHLPPSGWRGTSPAAGSFNVTLAAGAMATRRYFGDTQRGLISGSVFNDRNRNKIWDSGESGLYAWRVFLDSNKNGLLDRGEVSVLSDARGNWSFSNLAAGKYVVRVVQPTSWKQTTPKSSTITVKLASGGLSGRNLFGQVQIG